MATRTRETPNATAPADAGGADKPRRRRKKSEAPAPRGLTPAATRTTPTAAVTRLAQRVEEDGGAVLATYKEPLGGKWVLFVTLPADLIEPTPFQRDVSPGHVDRLSAVLDKVGRFLDPVIAIRSADGRYWTPNGNHRLQALRGLGGRSITALLLPEPEMAYTILALNTEKAHNVREKSLEVIRMARSLAASDGLPEQAYAFEFEEPSYLTLGLCYEERPRVAGGAYQPVLRRVDRFMRSALPKALSIREERTTQLLALDQRVNEIISLLKERGLTSPYLRPYVIARVNPLRFKRDAKAEFDEVIGSMLKAAERFDIGKVRDQDLARAGGPPVPED